MAVQQNKKSRSRKGMRRSHDRVATPTVIYCSCGELTVPQLRRLQGPSGDRQDRS